MNAQDIIKAIKITAKESAGNGDIIKDTIVMVLRGIVARAERYEAMEAAFDEKNHQECLEDAQD